MITAGIDGGSRTVKVALWDGLAGRIRGLALRDQGIDQAGIARDMLAGLLVQAGIDRGDLGPVVATGYARGLVQADRQVTEITCHARGVRHLVPAACGIVEIGGQDSKIIRLGADGRVNDFAMNDRCAAGTGRFLEVLAVRLETSLTDFAALLACGESVAPISSMCVVFAETEITGLLAGGTDPTAIARGVMAAVAERVASLAGRRLPEPVVFTGGVALVPGMREALAHALGREVSVCPEAQFSGAIGAALIAEDG